MTAPAPLAARRLGEALRAAGRDRARVTFPSPLFRGRIVEFARDVLGIRSLASHQVEVLQEWQKDGRVEIVQCTGQKLGKTAILEIVGAYEFAVTPRLNCFIVGPKLDHTDEVFWPRFALLVLAAYYPCAACMPAHRAWCALVETNPLDETPRPERCPSCSPLIPSELVDPRRPDRGRSSKWLDVRNSENGLRAPDGRAIRGYTARDEGAMGGHSGAVVFIGDEGSDISDRDRETIRGNMSGGGKAIFAGNMLYTWGWFYRAFGNGAPPGLRVWGTAPTGERTFQMSSRLSPNCPGRITWSDGVVSENRTGDRPVRGMATREDIEANLRAWKGTALIEARVDATAPRVVAGQIAPADRVKEAEERWRSGQVTGLLQIGVDVARARDRLAICVRRGSTMLDLFAEALHEDDHARGVQLALDYARKHRRPHERKPRFVFDASGLEGKAFADELSAQNAEAEVDLYPVHMSHPPKRRALFDKRRDEIAHGFAEQLKRIAILTDVELEGEIAATVGENVEVTYSGKKWRAFRVIDNDTMRTRIGRSPDKRNACELAFLDVDGSEAEQAVESDDPSVESAAAALASTRAGRPARPRPASRHLDDDDGPLPTFDPYRLADAATGWGVR